MKEKLENIDLIDEYKSIRYLNLFRLLLSLFFFSIIFNFVKGYIGFSYTRDFAEFTASLYLAFAVIIWLLSFINKKYSLQIGMFALVSDLPFVISLIVLFDGMNQGWAILPVITIGSFAILSRSVIAILLMPIIASLLLWFIPNKIVGIDDYHINLSTVVLYSFTYFAIAFVGIRQSQTYYHSLLLSQKQKKSILNLSQINKLIIDKMNFGVIAFDRKFNVVLINKKAQEIIKIKEKQKLPDKLQHKLVNEIITKHSNKNYTIYGEDLLLDVLDLDTNSDLRLLFIEQQSAINSKSQQINLATLGQFSAIIAHELRNPMAAIYSAAELLHESETLNEEDKQLSTIISNHIERSNRIIEDILLMSKPHMAEQIRIRLPEKLLKFKHDFLMQHPNSKNSIQLKLSSNTHKINFDNTHLNQLLWNLTENALKHGEDKKLIIETSNFINTVYLDFKNIGSPFTHKVEENLFTPFFTTHTQGTGLGLYICREMCRANQAKLEYFYQQPYHIFRIHILVKV